MQRGFAPILVLVGLLILVAVGGGAYFFGRSQVPKSQPSNLVAVSPTPQTIPSDETANWKTYINNDGEYAIKYPINIFVEEKEVGCSRKTGSKFSLYKKPEQKIDCKNFDYNPYLEILPGPQQDQTSGSNNQCASARREEIKIDGSSARKITMVFDTKSQKCQDKEWLAYVDKVGSKSVQIFVDSRPPVVFVYTVRDVPEDLINEIISTFKFLHQGEPAEAVGWKTYENERVTFKFPSKWIQKPILKSGSGFTQEFNDPAGKLTFTLSSIDNYNQQTGKSYSTIDEYIGLSYKVKTVYIDGQEGRQALPRAGSENVYGVNFFSKDSKLIYGLSLKVGNTALETPEKEVEAAEGIFNQIISTFKFVN